MSTQRTLLKMKTRSTEGSGGSRTPNVPSVGGTQKPAHGTHLNAENSMVPSQQPDDRQYNTPIGNIAEAALLIQRLPQNPKTERLLHLTQRTIIQLDQRDPMPSLQRTRSRSGRHESSIPQVSRTLGGAPIPRGNHNRHHNQDNRSGHGHQHAQQFARGHADQEVQQPPLQTYIHQVARLQAGGHSTGGHDHRRNLRDLPIVDLRQKMNEGRDAQDVIDSRCREHYGDPRDIETMTAS
jgi:hypothetical protein